MDREKDREKETERGETERELKKWDEYKGEGTKQEEVTDFGTHGEYFNHCKWRFWGPWGFMGILSFPFSAPKGKERVDFL